MTDSSGEKQVPPQIDQALKSWRLWSNLTRILHIGLGTMATVCSLLVAANLDSVDRVALQWTAFMAAVSAGLLTAFDLGTKANNFRTAWRKLNAAVIKFHQMPNFTLKELIEVYERGEETIGEVTTRT